MSGLPSILNEYKEGFVGIEEVADKIRGLQWGNERLAARVGELENEIERLGVRRRLVAERLAAMHSALRKHHDISSGDAIGTYGEGCEHYCPVCRDVSRHSPECDSQYLDPDNSYQPGQCNCGLYDCITQSGNAQSALAQGGGS